MVILLLLFQEGKYHEALGKWEAALTLMPNNAILHEQKAQILLELGDAWRALTAATSMYALVQFTCPFKDSNDNDLLGCHELGTVPSFLIGLSFQHRFAVSRIYSIHVLFSRQKCVLVVLLTGHCKMHKTYINSRASIKNKEELLHSIHKNEE